MRLNIIAAVLVILPNFSLVAAACSKKWGYCNLGPGGASCCDGLMLVLQPRYVIARFAFQEQAEVADATLVLHAQMVFVARILVTSPIALLAATPTSTVDRSLVCLKCKQQNETCDPGSLSPGGIWRRHPEKCCENGFCFRSPTENRNKCVASAHTVVIVLARLRHVARAATADHRRMIVPVLLGGRAFIIALASCPVRAAQVLTELVVAPVILAGKMGNVGPGGVSRQVPEETMIFVLARTIAARVPTVFGLDGCRHQLETSRSPAGFQCKEGMGPPWIQFSWQPAGEPDGRHIDRKVITVVLQDGPERAEGQRLRLEQLLAAWRPQASKCAEASERADERGASERTDERGPRASECADKRGASERADGQVDEAAERGQGGTRASGQAAQATRVGEQRVSEGQAIRWGVGGAGKRAGRCVDRQAAASGALGERASEAMEGQWKVVVCHSTTFYGDPLAAVRKAAKHLAVKLEASCICAWEKIAGNHMDTGWYQLVNWLIPAEVASWLVPDGSLAVYRCLAPTHRRLA
ncbi:hypothetical protein GGX14DRAFT_546090 [Mycena pura]|uniref:Uncharacterized protein n=1 Tax=Mycena pura TaxID=153505 RepID=A0AAD6UTB6_9AGAR|nr:hypothetical protein GGX14DRAFT_546090 [Mycena pura]